MTINPNWPYIIVIAALLSCAFALFISWLHFHRRYGGFWKANAWIEVVAGCLLIDATAWAVLGIDILLPLLLIEAVWGLPMIVAILANYMREIAAVDDTAEARSIQ